MNSHTTTTANRLLTIAFSSTSCQSKINSIKIMIKKNESYNLRKKLIVVKKNFVKSTDF